MRNNLPVVSDKEYYMKNLSSFAELILQVKAGIICFQEIDFNSRRSHFVDQADYLMEKTSLLNVAYAVNWNKRYVPFPYWPPSAHFGKIISGQAVISLYPITGTRMITLERPDHSFLYNRFYLDRLIQEVQIQTDRDVITVLNVHLEAFDKATREEQAEFLLNYYKNNFINKGPVFILGDFNCVPPSASKQTDFPDEPETDYTSEKTIRLFLEEETLGNAMIHKPGNIHTYPSDAPDRKLDYIFFTSKYIHLIQAQLLNSESSDHLPLMMEFSLKQRKQ